jgi:hypothetical protein
MVMSKVTITFTREQANTIANIFGDGEWVQNSEYPKSDPQNAFYQRIADKIRKALREQA